jgi:hypothetical protein
VLVVCVLLDVDVEVTGVIVACGIGVVLSVIGVGDVSSGCGESVTTSDGVGLSGCAEAVTGAAQIAIAIANGIIARIIFVPLAPLKKPARGVLQALC